MAAAPEPRGLLAGEYASQDMQLRAVHADQEGFLVGEHVGGGTETVDVDEELGEEELEFVLEGWFEGLMVLACLFYELGPV